MGVCNCNSWNSPRPAICILLSFLFLLCLLAATPCASALSFDLTSIGPQHLNVNITLYGDANISDQGIQLTPDDPRSNRSQKAGRATYAERLHLGDKASRNLTDFSTYFEFVIDSNGSSDYGDGLAFFLAPADNNPKNITPGGAMGLPIDPVTIQPLSPFLAVEFDTFDNAWDPKGSKTHVGININSLTSKVTREWFSNISGGVTNKAQINYDSSSKNLSVVFSTSPVNDASTEGALHFLVDLREYLPEQVAIGFSASTGGSFERNNVKSWNFSSSRIVRKKTAPSPGPWPSGVSPEEESGGTSNNKGLVVVLSVGLLVLVVVLALASFVFWKRRRENKEVEEFAIELSMVNDFGTSTGPKKFSYHELSLSTNSFSEEHKLGEGGFGGVYRGFLRELNSYVAVKRISKGSKQGIKEYVSEVKIISQLRHRNLVQLVG